MLQEHRTKVLKGNPLEVQRVIRTHVPSTKDSEAAGPHAMEGQKPLTLFKQRVATKQPEGTLSSLNNAEGTLSSQNNAFILPGGHPSTSVKCRSTAVDVGM